MRKFTCERSLKSLFVCLPAAMAFSLLASVGPASAQSDGGQPIPLQNLDAFREPGANWSIGSGAIADLTKDGYMKALPGSDVLVNVMNPKNNTHLLTKKEFGDLELELDFMMAKNSNSGVYLQGRYEIQLLDSWNKLNPEFSDVGGIYQRWDDGRGEGREGYEGIPPFMNVAKAPGLWQHLKISFQAPRFNDRGEKTSNARFKKVYLNGVLVQLESDVTGPTRSSFFNDEKPLGPLMLQGDHGNVAFRNIHYYIPDYSQPDTLAKDMNTDNPIVVNPDGKPYLLRSFLQYGDKKLTHVISAGYPNQSNYSYDLKQGALLQIWRGKFLDVTDMWHDRGEPQLAKPLGSVTTLTDAPFAAVLSDANAPWPDSVAFDDCRTKGYTLDAARNATYEYALNGVEITDKISVTQAGSLTRDLTVTNPPAGFYGRIAAADRIESASKGMYAIGAPAYFIQMDERVKPIIRTTSQGKELLIPITKTAASITYSIIW